MTKITTLWAMRADASHQYPLEVSIARKELDVGSGYVLCRRAMKRLGLSKLPLNVPTKITITVEVPDVR